MATATEIIARVADIIQDDSYTDADILDLINEGRFAIAGMQGLPNLLASADVSTAEDESSVELPATYHNGLYWVGSSAQGRRIGERKSDYYNQARFNDKYPVRDIVGEISDVCVEGGNLIYQGMAADTLTLRFFEKPVIIPTPAEPVDPDDPTTPVELPDHLQMPLLKHYCCKEIFTEIEDGMDGRKVNTEHHENQFAKYMAKLEEFVRPYLPREVKQVRDVN